MRDATPRILVVDDVPENVRLLEAVLEPHDYEVVSATDGHVALELAESEKPDLVLLDVMMPQPDGLAVCRRLRELARIGRSPGHASSVRRPGPRHELGISVGASR